MLKNTLQFSDKTLNDRILFTNFEKKFNEYPIFIFTDMLIYIDGYSKKDNVKVELLDLINLQEQLNKFTQENLNQIYFYNIDETFEINIIRTIDEIKINGVLNNSQHTVKLNFEFESDPTVINNIIEQLNVVLREFKN